MNEMLTNALAAAGIAALLAWTLFLVMQISAAREERRSTDRRLGVLENEVRELREIYSEISGMEMLLKQIVKTQEKDTSKLDGLAEWQHKHERIIEDAATFITEIRNDGARVKT